MKLSTLLSLAISLASSSIASPLSLEARQSSQWQYTCGTSLAAPSDFRAFNLASCAAQLSFTKDRYVAVNWAFDAIYADGSKATYAPYRDFNTFGVSDPFYPYLGNNFNTRLPGSSAFTAIHEFTNVCQNGQAPVAWEFYTTTKPCSTNTYTSGQIPVSLGGANTTRPPKASGVSLSRLNTAGDFQVSWSAIASAAAYSVIVEYPTGTDEAGNAYTSVRGARIQAGTLSTTIPTGTRRPGDSRRVIVHVVDSQGLWSFTNDVPIVSGN